MKTRLFILLCFCGNVYAEPDILPPIVDKSGNPQESSYRRKTSVSPIYEVLNRLDQLQREIQQLRGQVEEQAYTIEGLKKQQQTMYTDLDDRLQQTETRKSGKKPSP